MAVGGPRRSPNAPSRFARSWPNKATGYGYIYTKTMRIAGDRPVLTIHHRLQNTGTQPLVTSVYDHNFFATGRPTDAGFRFVAPWPITAEAISRPDLVQVTGNVFEIRHAFAPTDMQAIWLKGFDGTPRDYAFRVEDVQTGLGYSVQGDRPLDRLMTWTIWTNLSVESFIRLQADPGKEERWSYTYTYSTPR